MLLAMTPVLASEPDPTSETFTMFAWRSLGYWSNDGPFQELKIHCYLGTDAMSGVGETGQAEQGWHELHPYPGYQTASFDDRGYAYPSIAGPVLARKQACTVFDLPIYSVYEADCLLWGQSFGEIGQTFVATGDELDKVAMLVPNPEDEFELIVRENGPDGKQIGSPGTLKSGYSMSWGIARWMPGDVVLTPGKTYYIGIKGKSGKPFTTYMHSTGDVYPGGCAYFNGVAEPLSDLGLFISLQRDDMIRSPILYARQEGWVLRSRGVYFKARSANLRVAYAHVRLKDSPGYLNLVFRVHKLGPKGELVRVGPEKVCYDYRQRGEEHYFGSLWAANDVPLEVGATYFLELLPKSDELPSDESKLPRCDLLVRLYGEKTAGMTPVIFNQRVAATSPTSISLAWEGTTDCAVRVCYGLSPYKLDREVFPSRGKQEVELRPILPGTTVNFRIIATTAAGGKFETPVYQARTRDAEGRPVTEPPLKPTPAHEFLEPPCIGFINLAPMDRLIEPALPDGAMGASVAILNPGFEDGLTGWQTGENTSVKAVPIGKSGAASGGWDLAFTQEPGKQTFAEEVIYRKVSVVPGKTYLLSAHLLTDQKGHALDWNSRIQRGDVRIRLFCDPSGGTDFACANSTQWLRTDGAWMRFGKKWKATSDVMTIGVGFFRWRDWPMVRALVDDVTLREVAP